MSQTQHLVKQSKKVQGLFSGSKITVKLGKNTDQGFEVELPADLPPNLVYLAAEVGFFGFLTVSPGTFSGLARFFGQVPREGDAVSFVALEPVSFRGLPDMSAEPQAKPKPHKKPVKK